MNGDLETDIKQFGQFVEKVVRPVRVPMKRKKRMREELLSHMHEVLDGIDNGKQETIDQEQISQTISRMGDHAELTKELRSEETLYGRWYLHLEELRYDPSKSINVFLLKHISIGFALGIFTSVLILMLSFLKPNPLGVLGCFYIGFITSLVHFLFVIPFLLLLDPITRFVHGLEGKSTRLRVICYILVSCLMLPTIAIAINYRFQESFRLDHIGLGILMAPIVPLIILAMTKPAAEEIVYYEKWANLEID